MSDVPNKPGRSVASGWRGLSRDRGGAVALEFGIIGLAFFGLVLFTISLGFRLYVQVALDYAASRAARLLAVNTNQSLSQNATNFQSVTFCPNLFLPCAGLRISLVSVTDYRNATPDTGSGTPPFSPGQSGSLMLLRVTYNLPPLGWPSPTGGPTVGFGPTVSASYPYQNEY